MKKRAADQKIIIAHDKRVLQATRWVKAMPPDVARFWFPNAVRVRHFHAAQKIWTTRELAESERMLQAFSTSPGVPSWWLPAALCIHRYESIDWHNQGAHRGGMQFAQSTWESVGGRGDPALASPSEQLYRAYLVWKRDGGSWREWSTAGLCGLR